MTSPYTTPTGPPPRIPKPRVWRGYLRKIRSELPRGPLRGLLTATINRYSGDLDLPSARKRRTILGLNVVRTRTSPRSVTLSYHSGIQHGFDKTSKEFMLISESIHHEWGLTRLLRRWVRRSFVPFHYEPPPGIEWDTYPDNGDSIDHWAGSAYRKDPAKTELVAVLEMRRYLDVPEQQQGFTLYKRDRLYGKAMTYEVIACKPEMTIWILIDRRVLDMFYDAQYNDRLAMVAKLQRAQ